MAGFYNLGVSKTESVVCKNATELKNLERILVKEGMLFRGVFNGMMGMRNPVCFHLWKHQFVNADAKSIPFSEFEERYKNNSNRVKICYSKIIPPKRFVAINLFNYVIINERYRKYLQTHPVFFEKLKRHEWHHTLQMKALGYIGFYVLYAVEWILKLVINVIKAIFGIRKWKNLMFDTYYNVSFEVVARKASESKQTMYKFNETDWIAFV